MPYDVSSFIGSEALDQLKNAGKNAAKESRKAAEEEAARQYYSTTEQLGSQERGLRANQPLIEEGILTSIEREKLPIYQGKEESLAALGRGERDLRDATRSGINLASRTFNELATAIPRYAGTSAAGAVGEIIGRQTARDIGGLKREEQKGIFDIGQEKNRVVKFATDKIAAIEATGQNLIRQAKQDFLNAIDKINTLKRIAENDKNSMRKQALYNYQAAIQNIGAEISSEKYSLQKWAFQKNQELENRVQSGSGFDFNSFFGNLNQNQDNTPGFAQQNYDVGDYGSGNIGGPVSDYVPNLGYSTGNYSANQSDTLDSLGTDIDNFLLTGGVSQ